MWAYGPPTPVQLPTSASRSGWLTTRVARHERTTIALCHPRVLARPARPGWAYGPPIVYKHLRTGCGPERPNRVLHHPVLRPGVRSTPFGRARSLPVATTGEVGRPQGAVPRLTPSARATREGGPQAEGPQGRPQSVARALALITRTPFGWFS